MGDLPEEVASWLVGGGNGAPADDRQGADIPRDAAGLLQRMLQHFQGDPIGPAEALNAGAGLVTLHPPDLAISAVISVNAVSCRVKVDGAAPTAAVGLLVAAGSILVVTGRASLHGFQAIGTAPGSLLDVLYFT